MQFYFLPLLLVIVLSTNVAYGEIRWNIFSVPDVEPTVFGLTGRIVNGTKAALRQFPYQVSLRRSYSTRHFCGGSIISEKYVLTAGHCMYMNGMPIQAWTIMVVAGEIQLNKETSTGQKRGVDKLIVHPNFVQTTLQNDIAILVLRVPFIMTEDVQAAPLAPHSLVVDTVCQVSGWGYPAEDDHEVSEDLMYVDLPILQPKRCKKLLENVTNLPAGMFCAGYEEGQRDACQGDSGGGMVCNGLLSGVVSGGEGCARPGFPGVYTDVFFFKDWVYKQTDIEPVTKGGHSQNESMNNSSSKQALTKALLYLLIASLGLFKL